MGDDYFHVDKDWEVPVRFDPFPNQKFGQAMNDPNPGTRRRTVFKALFARKRARKFGTSNCLRFDVGAREVHRFCHKILWEIGWILERTIACNCRCPAQFSCSAATQCSRLS